MFLIASVIFPIIIVQFTFLPTVYMGSLSPHPHHDSSFCLCFSNRISPSLGWLRTSAPHLMLFSICLLITRAHYYQPLWTSHSTRCEVIPHVVLISTSPCALVVVYVFIYLRGHLFVDLVWEVSSQILARFPVWLLASLLSNSSHDFEFNPLSHTWIANTLSHSIS